MAILIFQADGLDILQRAPSNYFQLIYIDPPFNTGKRQVRRTLKTTQNRVGDRTGYQGKRYRTEVLGQKSYQDHYDDYIGFLRPYFQEVARVLSPEGSFFLHVDYREVHYCKVELDQIFGRACFRNEIIWSYDYGARSKKRWSTKHDNILWYSRDPERYCFNFDEIDRIPYLAPGLVGAEKAERGKTPTDVWWNTIVPTNGKEKTGYPTQKPLGILNRIVQVHSNPGDRLLDFFAGSGSFGEAAALHSRDVVLVDQNPEAIGIMEQRFRHYTDLKIMAG